MVMSKPFLPAEIIALVLNYLPVPDLLRAARVSRKVHEMVYDDTRWIQKLRLLGVWSEAEARRRVEEAQKRRLEQQRAREADEARRTGARLAGSVNGIAGGGPSRTGNVTLFDVGIEEDKIRRSVEQVQSQVGELSIPPTSSGHSTTPSGEHNAALHVLAQARSIRGRARHEFSIIYAALAPLYLNLIRSRKHSDAIVFKTYRDPEHQARILASLKQFARCDSANGWQEREQKVESVMGVFENAVLREFEQGCAAGDVEGRMHRYAHVLVRLNGGAAAIDSFISHHPIMSRRLVVGPAQNFFENLANKVIEQAGVIDRVFPESVDVLTPFLERLCEQIINEYLLTLFQEARGKGIETWVKAIAGTLEQALRFVASLQPTKASPPNFLERVKGMILPFYEQRMDRYLGDELALFLDKSDSEVSLWEKDFSDSGRL